jgi:hypothetical protein
MLPMPPPTWTRSVPDRETCTSAVLEGVRGVVLDSPGDRAIVIDAMAENPVSKPVRPSTYGLTRSEVARQLGVSTTEVHRMRLRGALRPKRDERGVWRYDPAEVVRAAAGRHTAARRTRGQTAALAFRCSTRGVSSRTW